MRKKNKSNKWEKKFLISNIVIIAIIIGIYAYRMIHYYIVMNVKVNDSTSLYEVVTNKGNIVYSGDGLYDDDGYYYKGIDVNNYVMYSNMLFRIVSLDKDSIKLISDKIITSMVWGYDSNYQDSYINKLVNNIGIDESLLINSKWCDSKIDINNYNCTNYIDSKIGLMSSYEYLRAGGINSYLNNGEYYWLIDYDNDMMVYYVFNTGGINNQYKSNDTYYSYGVRPMISINIDTIYSSGDGTKDNPYIIGDSTYKIGKDITYKNYSFKILDTNSEYTKLILNDYLYDENNEKIKLNYNDTINYINNNFVNKFDTISCEFKKGNYNNLNKYDYLDNSIYNGYGYLPKVGDISINDLDGIWLANSYNDSLSYTVSGSSLFADLNSNTNYIRPVICVKTSSLEEQDEINN